MCCISQEHHDDISDDDVNMCSCFSKSTVGNLTTAMPTELAWEK